MLIAFYIVSLFSCSFSVYCEELNVNSFPQNFLFGVSTSTYQIEEPWNKSGKGESTHSFTHKRSQLKANGDVACDSYHKIKEDVKLLKELGVDFYKFSFSWSKILPQGFSYKVNDDAISCYNDLVNLLTKNDIQPVATMFNWNLPQTIQELGGFSNQLIADWFTDYAKVLFDKFGDRIKLWITINEPQRLCIDGYGGFKIAPGINMSYIATYTCGHNILKTHAKVYHLYNTSFKNTQNGQVSIALENNWYEPSMEDVEGSKKTHPYLFQWFADPIFGNGDYPAEIKDFIKQQSLNDGFKQTQLPEFTKDESYYIQGTCDFCAITYYKHEFVGHNTKRAQIDTNNIANSFQNSLKIIKEKYSNIPIFVVENGFADEGELNDYYRVKYLKAHLEALSYAIVHDEVKVIGYGVWSLLDNFDWNNGYLSNYGLFHVNFSDPERPRVAKTSAKFYSDFLSKKKMNKNGVENLANIPMLIIIVISLLHTVHVVKIFLS